VRKQRVGIRAWVAWLGLEKAVLEGIDSDEQGAIVVAVRPCAREQRRCPRCHRRCARYDAGEGQRRWRALDLGTTFCYLEADAPRIHCKRHGVLVAAVPWARHDSRFTRSFEDEVAWLAVNTSKSAICALMRIAWRTVGRICERVATEAKRARDLLSGLERIGIDEISHRRGQRYITVVVDHDTGRLVWAHPGRDKVTVHRLLDALGAERCANIKLVSCDDAEWITGPVSERCGNATICLDPFHIAKAAGDALDEVRREVWRQARRAGQGRLAGELKGTRYALCKRPESLTERQQAKLAWIAKLNGPLYRAYLLKEQLRMIFHVPRASALMLLADWLAWAARSRLEPFRKLARRIKQRRALVEASLSNNMSNARVEQVNTQLRLIMRRGFGYHSPEAVISLAMLSLGGLCPPLPGR
jgi:transposase